MDNIKNRIIELENEALADKGQAELLNREMMVLQERAGAVQKELGEIQSRQLRREAASEELLRLLDKSTDPQGEEINSHAD